MWTYEKKTGSKACVKYKHYLHATERNEWDW